MKRALAFVLVSTLTAFLGMTGCGKKMSSQETFLSEGIETKAELETKDIIALHSIRPEPDYDYQVWMSDDIIYGEVIEELEGRYSNPNGEYGDLANMWITPYVIKVQKSYKGVINEGETIIVNTWNYFSPEEKNKFVVVTDNVEFYLYQGQSGIFMLERTKYLTTEDNKPVYHVVMGHEGLFQVKDTDISLMSEEDEVVYASPYFELTLDQIAGDIKKADELYKDVDKNAPSEIFVNDEEVDAAAGQTNGITE